MDPERLDLLARGLPSGISRRGIERNLTGATLGGILVAGSVSEAGARKRRWKRAKPYLDLNRLPVIQVSSTALTCTAPMSTSA